MTKNAQQVLEDSAQQIFPDYFPADVPPKESLDAGGVFYRLARNNPPGKACFLNMKEENPKRMKKFQGLQLKCCYGVSMFMDETSLVNVFNKFPEGIGERFIAKGELNPQDGRMLKTGAPDSTHFTIWLCKDARVHEKFTCIREVVR
ncbi:hypothetical protein CT308_002237 [Shigella flexneri]|nr:hypothetical protein [Shigella flexneri]